MRQSGGLSLATGSTVAAPLITTRTEKDNRPFGGAFFRDGRIIPKMMEEGMLYSRNYKRSALIRSPLLKMHIACGK